MGGRKSRLSAEQQAELKERLAAEEYWTLKEVKEWIAQTFGVTYSESHLRRLLRNMGLKCVKPYMMDYRRPENAEQILRGRVRIALEQVRAEAEKLGIHLVYLPPYSPDLNPIEQIWRVIRRELSTLLVENVKQMQEIIRAHFERLVYRLTFCRAWITSFFNHAWNATFCSN